MSIDYLIFESQWEANNIEKNFVSLAQAKVFYEKDNPK